MKTNIKPAILALGFSLLLLAPQQARAYYNSSTGRWINRDPEEEGGGVGLYGFVENCPVAAIDGLGLVIVGFYGADISSKEPNAGNQHLEEISAYMERYERVLRPKSGSRAHPLYTSRAVSQAIVDLLFYLDTNHDGFYDPPCDEEQVIKIFGWSWGGSFRGRTGQPNQEE